MGGHDLAGKVNKNVLAVSTAKKTNNLAPKEEAVTSHSFQLGSQGSSPKNVIASFITKPDYVQRKKLNVREPIYK